MEQPDPRKSHHHLIFIAAFDHQIVPHRTAGLGNIFYAALVSPFDIVGEGEESVGAKSHVLISVQPCPLFFSGKDRRLYLKALLPFAFP